MDQLTKLERATLERAVADGGAVSVDRLQPWVYAAEHLVELGLFIRRTERVDGFERPRYAVTELGFLVHRGPAIPERRLVCADCGKDQAHEADGEAAHASKPYVYDDALCWAAYNVRECRSKEAWRSEAIALRAKWAATGIDVHPGHERGFSVFVARIDALNIISQGRTEPQAIAAVMEAVTLLLNHWRERALPTREALEKARVLSDAYAETGWISPANVEALMSAFNTLDQKGERIAPLSERVERAREHFERALRPEEPTHEPTRAEVVRAGIEFEKAAIVHTAPLPERQVPTIDLMGMTLGEVVQALTTDQPAGPAIARAHAESLVPPARPKCWCRRCEDQWADALHSFNPAMWPMRTFIVCPTCGNKRCPRAESHGFRCSSSNELDQVGVPIDSTEARRLDAAADDTIRTLAMSGRWSQWDEDTEVAER
jgi:hypothetical protein